MARIHSRPIVARFTVAGAFAALLLGTSALSTPALATQKVIYQDLEKDGSVSMLIYDTNTKMEWYVSINKDGKLVQISIVNPNPDDTTTGKGSHSDKPDVVQLIKVGAVTYEVPVAPADVPQLMAHLRGVLGDGGGLGPHYNPSDDDNGNGPGAAPSHSMEVKKTPDEIREEIAVANEIVAALAVLGSAMGDGDEGGSESPNGANKNGNGTGKGAGDDQGNYTEGQDKDIGQTEKDLLGPKPDVVNPPHLDRTATGGVGDHSSSATGGGTGGGGSDSGKGGGGTAKVGGGLGTGGAHNSLGGGAHSATGVHG